MTYRALVVVVLSACVAVFAVLGLVRLLVGRQGKTAADETPTIRRWSLWERLVHFAMAASAGALIVTGFAQQLLWGERLSGVWLMIHVTFGGVFAVSLALMVLTWQRAARFDRGDRGYRPVALLLGDPAPAGRWDAGQKGLFWLVGWAGLVLVATEMLAMTPLWTPEQIDWLYEAHRLTALAMLAAALVHAAVMLTVKRGGLHGMVKGRVGASWARRYHRRWFETLTDREQTK